MHPVAATMMVLLSLLSAPKTWYAPSQPWTVTLKNAEPNTHLVLTDFSGKPVSAASALDIPAGDHSYDLKTLFPALESSPNTYLLYAVHAGDTDATHFLGTPLVVDVREDERRPGSGPMVVRIEPLQYALINTDAGPLTVQFYYDVAPHTVRNFVTLASQGFYDGLTFHRIVPGFLIQAGDPLGNGTGGPGYHIEAEFNGRPHLDGVLSMARSTDPNEAAGALPRAEFANSAGSQFFICLDYALTRKLDHRYTAFARVTEGMDVVSALAKSPLADPRTGKPVHPPVIESIQILPVTAAHNPYSKIVKLDSVPTTAPIAAPPTTQSTIPINPGPRTPANQAQ